MTRLNLVVLALAMLLFTVASTGFAAAERAANEAQPAKGERLEKAKAMFESYQKLERDFDPKVADFYADTAVIRVRRIYPGGAKRDLEMSGVQLKKLLPTALPLGKVRGDTNTYSKLKFTMEGEGVRISGERYSDLKRTTSPWSQYVKPDANGEWLIYEETAESQVVGN